MLEGMTGTVISTTDELRRQAADLQLLGLRQIEIAERLGVSQPRVSQLLAEGRAQWRSETVKSYEEHLNETLERCNLLLSKLESGINIGDPRSIDSAVKLIDRISKLLGLDHKDRMSERTVRVAEAQVQLVGVALAAVLDHLGVTGEARIEAVQVLQAELEKGSAAI